MRWSSKTGTCPKVDIAQKCTATTECAICKHFTVCNPAGSKAVLCWMLSRIATRVSTHPCWQVSSNQRLHTLAILTCRWSPCHGPLTACIFGARAERGIIATLSPGKQDAVSWLLHKRFFNLLVLASSETFQHVLHGHTSD